MAMPAEAALMAKASLAASVIDSYAEWVPAFKNAAVAGLKFSTALSEGRADLADPGSPVHMRFFRIEEVAPRFYNFNPGKLTLAQLASDCLCRLSEVKQSNPTDVLDGAIDHLIQGMTQNKERTVL
jgi:hypothetical protein